MLSVETISPLEGRKVSSLPRIHSHQSGTLHLSISNSFMLFINQSPRRSQISTGWFPDKAD